MKERPILFNGAMVRSILAGRKTQTRRVIKPQFSTAAHAGDVEECYPHPGEWFQWFNGDEKSEAQPCPFGTVGDRLIVASEIPGIPSAYCAGSDGQIYSRARGDWRPLKAFRNKKGYRTVTICDDIRFGPGGKRSYTVHSLVCSAFSGRPTAMHMQVRHLDGNPDNNLPDNLAWGTRADNWQDRKAHGNGVEGEKHHQAKFSDTERAHIRWAVSQGLCSQRAASRVLGITQAAISQMMVGVELVPAQVTEPGPRIPRITLEVTDVRVERLWDISAGDSIAEGIREVAKDGNIKKYCVYDKRDMSSVPWSEMPRDPKDAFAALWHSTGGHETWASNAWVWVIEFKRVTP